jgi:hypothetical protein
LVKTDDLEPVWSEAERRVQKIQSKLHRWRDCCVRRDRVCAARLMA